MFDHHKSFRETGQGQLLKQFLLKVLFYKSGPEKELEQRVNISHRLS